MLSRVTHPLHRHVSRGFSTAASRQQATSLRLYRILLRDCQRVQGGSRTCPDTVGPLLLVQRDLHPRDWGSARYVSSPYLTNNASSQMTDWKELWHVFVKSLALQTSAAKGPTGVPRNITLHSPEFHTLEEVNDDDDEDVNEDDDDVNEEEDDGDEVVNEEEDDDDDDEDEVEEFVAAYVEDDSDSDSDSDSDGDDEEDYLDPSMGSDQDGSSSIMESFFISSDVLRQCLRHVFRLPHDDPLLLKLHQLNHCNNNMSLLTMRHKYAIDAYQWLGTLLALRENTSVYNHPEHPLRVIATSKFLAQPEAHKYRFTYRIRIENCAEPGGNHYQLLGRSWDITEQDPKFAKDLETMHMNAPTTGAVGHLPVIAPGHVFEYMSGCDLATPLGRMEGFFYMAKVDEDATSTIVGEMPYHKDPTDKIKTQLKDENLFHLPVANFPLRP